MAHISSRSGIRWGIRADSDSETEAVPFAEPTETIVVTSPEGRFVDVRVLRNMEVLQDGTLPPSALDWAFAGTTTTTTTTTGDASSNENEKRKCVFTHWIDSRTADAASVIDEGETSPFEKEKDGRTRNLTLERGEMTNPATGKISSYEELWEDIPVQNVPLLSMSNETDSPSPSPKPGPGSEDEKKICVVLQMESSQMENQVTRGMVIRLGQYCQGIVRQGEQVLVERLRWDDDQQTWLRPVLVHVRTSGTETELDLEAPTDFATYFGHEAVVGDEVGVGGYVWRVVERSS